MIKRKIIFKGNQLTMYKAKKHIKHIYARRIIEEENLWYWEWKSILHKLSASSTKDWKKFHHSMMPRRKVIGVFAGLSVQKGLNQNLKLAENMCMTGDCGHMPEMKKKAKDIIYSDGTDNEIWDILNGNKIQNFYMNLMYPDDKRFVTIARHAISIALGRQATDKEHSLTDKHYQFFAECYKEVGQELDLIPNFVQSITWQAWKRIKTAKN